LAHRHDDHGGRGEEQTMIVGRDLVTYARCTCSCGTEWNDITNTIRDPEK
jgi:hypothetical protein